MDFHSYVPKGAREHALHYLEHFEPVLLEYEKRLSEIEERISYWLDSNQDADYAEVQLAELRKSKTAETKGRDDYARDIASIKRLVHDDRMKEAYRILSNAFFDDEDSEQQRKFDGFIYAAWSACLDFSPYREGVKRAETLRDEIAKTADKLACLLDRVSGTGVMYPSEFFSIPELLRNTDNHEMQNHNLYMWRAIRGYVLGDPPQRKRTENEQTEIDPTYKPEIVIQSVAWDEELDIDPDQKVRNTLRYAWEKSPSLSALLKTVSKAAREYEPCEGGMIGAAIDSQKRNEKTEYLRAFANLLREQHRFILTAEIMKAMAVTANVVINSTEINVSYDDVRKSLKKLGGDAPED
jgi:hypothetical protein